MSWTPYVRTLALSVVIVLAVAFGLIMLMNPYGNLPFRLAGQHVMMDSNRRFQLAAALRYGNFDSVILGTSTSMLLDPEEHRRICILRRVLNDMNPVDAMELLVTRLKKTQNNAEFLLSIKPGAA